MRSLFKVFLILTMLALAAPALAQTATATLSSGAQTIGIGDTVTGSLTASQPSMTYTLQAQAGQMVSITLNSDAFDAYLTVTDGSGTLLAENDDLNGSNAGIQNFVLPTASSYHIIADSFGNHEQSGAETGDYTLTVIEPKINPIEYTQTIHASLTTMEGSKDYVFSGQAGDVIVATESSSDSNFDAYLHLLDSTGNELTSNDDSGNSLNSTVGPFTLPNTGSYTLRATTIDGATAGNFTLTLEKVEVIPLSYDEPTDVSFTPNQTVKYFTFTGTAGELISIEANSHQSIDTSLTLTDANNSQIASDSDGGSGFDPEIFQQLLSSSGTYSVLLQATTPGTGKVTLTVTHTPPPSLDEGPQTVHLSDSQNASAVMFTAKAGETVRLNLHLSAGQNGSPSVTVMQNDSTLASASGSSISDLNFSFTTESAGSVIVEIMDYSYSDLSYEVTLAHLTE